VHSYNGLKEIYNNYVKFQIKNSKYSRDAVMCSFRMIKFIRRKALALFPGFSSGQEKVRGANASPGMAHFKYRSIVFEVQ